MWFECGEVADPHMTGEQPTTVAVAKQNRKKCLFSVSFFFVLLLGWKEPSLARAESPTRPIEKLSQSELKAIESVIPKLLKDWSPDDHFPEIAGIRRDGNEPNDGGWIVFEGEERNHYTLRIDKGSIDDTYVMSYRWDAGAGNWGFGTVHATGGAEIFTREVCGVYRCERTVHQDGKVLSKLEYSTGLEERENNREKVAAPYGWRLPEAKDAVGDWKPSGKESPFVAKGDFNGDGVEDEAWILLKTGSEMGGLYVFFKSAKGGATPQLLAKVDHPRSMGVSAVPPGEYETWCGKSGQCQDGEAKIVSSKIPALSFFQFESASSIFIWNPTDKKFDRFWTSD